MINFINNQRGIIIMKKIFIIYFSLWLCLTNTCNANNAMPNNNNYEEQKETRFERYLRIVNNIVMIVGGLIDIRNGLGLNQQAHAPLQIDNEIVYEF